MIFNYMNFNELKTVVLLFFLSGEGPDGAAAEVSEGEFEAEAEFLAMGGWLRGRWQQDSSP